MRNIPEKDWKYRRSIEKELLNTLCDSINQKCEEILENDESSEHKKYLKLHKHIQRSDGIIGDCFNDWLRSTVWLKLRSLYNHNLLTDKHIESLSHETQSMLAFFDEVG